MNTYQYAPIHLEGRTTRLLRLRKGTGPNIECELFEAWLDRQDLVEYEALSYCWGGMELEELVMIDRKVLQIIRNLYWALRNLRSASIDRILWVDALCINQANTDERRHQVEQMGRVYSQAAQVLIWLGTATDDIKVLFQSLKKMEQELSKIPSQNRSSGYGQLWHSLQLKQRALHWSLELRQHAGLVTLLQRDWFKRVWILQEVANAKRATICCGVLAISTQTFVLAPSLLMVTPNTHCQAVLDIMPGSSRLESWWSQRRDLYTLLLNLLGAKRQSRGTKFTLCLA